MDYAIYEALGSVGFIRHWLREQYENDYMDVAICRDLRMTDSDRIRIKAGHRHLVGRRYPKALVGAHSIDYAVTTLWQSSGGKGECQAARWLYHQFVNRKQNVDYPMCSWAVGYLWDMWLKRPFKKGYKVAAPDDLYDECKNSNDWALVFLHIAEGA